MFTIQLTERRCVSDICFLVSEFPCECLWGWHIHLSTWLGDNRRPLFYLELGSIFNTLWRVLGKKMEWHLHQQSKSTEVNNFLSGTKTSLPTYAHFSTTCCKAIPGPASFKHSLGKCCKIVKCIKYLIKEQAFSCLCVALLHQSRGLNMAWETIHFLRWKWYFDLLSKKRHLSEICLLSELRVAPAEKGHF